VSCQSPIIVEVEVEVEGKPHYVTSPEVLDGETTNGQVFNDTAEKSRASPTSSSTYSNGDPLLHPSPMYTGCCCRSCEGGGWVGG
jgi:hypothetical protein